MKKQTIVVNLFGAPGSGKSTLMAELFAHLKNAGVDCEMAPEFAKELVWEKREKTFDDELYILAKQSHRLFRLNGQVDVAITGRPLLVSVLYNRLKGGSATFERLAKELFHKYDNVNYFVHRNKPYNPNGRNETKEESECRGQDLMQLLEDEGIPFTHVNGNTKDALWMIEDMMALLKDRQTEVE